MDKAKQEKTRIQSLMEKMSVKAKTSLSEEHKTLTDYLMVMIKNKDWHGVRDCAVDLEILETRMKYDID